MQEIDRLAERIKADDNSLVLGLAAVARLAFNLGITVALAPSADPVEIVEDLGFWFAGQVFNSLDTAPRRVPDTLRATMAVIDDIAAGVKKRLGMAG